MSLGQPRAFCIRWVTVVALSAVCACSIRPRNQERFAGVEAVTNLEDLRTSVCLWLDENDVSEWPPSGWSHGCTAADGERPDVFEPFGWIAEEAVVQRSYRVTDLSEGEAGSTFVLEAWDNTCSRRFAVVAVGYPSCEVLSRQLPR